MRKLPIGIQSFEKLIEDEYLYIDKTGYIHDLVTSGTTYFLSRPRRFGKSLFVSTLQAYFEGKKDLFEGLEIAGEEERKPAEDQWVSYPVLHFDFTGGEYRSAEGLSNVLGNILMNAEQRYGIEPGDGLDLPIRFSNLLDQLYVKTGKRAVVLADEYDKPLLDTMEQDPGQEEENRELFGDFFAVLKKQDRHLKFVFITGVTKFSKVSIFSDLNQLEDISLDVAYGAICGITKEELEKNLRGEIAASACQNNISYEMCLKELRDNYDGYHFSEELEDVYNPFSILNALKKKDFNRYWFETGTPTFLVRKLERSGLPVQDFTDGVSVTRDQMMNFRADDTDLIPLFYQSGYLTIKGFDRTFREYTLSFPNEEVKYGFFEAIVPMINAAYAGSTGAAGFSAGRMVRSLRNGDVDDFMQMLQALLASIPYYEGRAPQNEQQWRNLVYAVFSLLGQYIRTEVHSARGRSDCLMETNRILYVFEFKQDGTAEEALSQIDEKGYALPYQSTGKEIVKIGANFSTQKKTLDDWKIE